MYAVVRYLPHQLDNQVKAAQHVVALDRPWHCLLANDRRIQLLIPRHHIVEELVHQLVELSRTCRYLNEVVRVV